ncbi:MAG: DUF1206 domain-containing protein, partial [Bacteroidota bacterium]|nr:DUF1206 domain-containing protein [Bacteroidota bacterium]
GSLAIGGSGGGDGDSRQFVVSKILQQPGGQWIVGAIALFFIGYGIYQIYRALSGKFKKHVNQWQMSNKERSVYMRIGRLGFIARGIVLGVIGFLFIKASIASNASQAQGTEGAFQFLHDSGYGPWLMGSVAFGLFAFGVFCVVQARYRNIET